MALPGLAPARVTCSSGSCKGWGLDEGGVEGQDCKEVKRETVRREVEQRLCRAELESSTSLTAVPLGPMLSYSVKWAIDSVQDYQRYRAQQSVGAHQTHLRGAQTRSSHPCDFMGQQSEVC